MSDAGNSELPGLHVTIDDVVLQPQPMVPEGSPHCFAYFITIHNDSKVPVTIKGRKWVVRESNGEITAVEGDGVVGEFPHLRPGESFSYNSAHVFASSRATAVGSYIGHDDQNRTVVVPIPPFEMVANDQ
ncbi:MAG: magnesium transporter [Verrucomicrobiales bacterium]|nr:magnesium transporter [Verrucomicrobiales bacterium]|tara:strand:- start:1306 stop:1695 length:390 start_codon:yes stop_codon:yes gene_type:complete